MSWVDGSVGQGLLHRGEDLRLSPGSPSKPGTVWYMLMTTSVGVQGIQVASEILGTLPFLLISLKQGRIAGMSHQIPLHEDSGDLHSGAPHSPSHLPASRQVFYSVCWSPRLHTTLWCLQVRRLCHS